MTTRHEKEANMSDPENLEASLCPACGTSKVEQSRDAAGVCIRISCGCSEDPVVIVGTTPFKVAIAVWNTLVAGRMPEYQRGKSICAPFYCGLNWLSVMCRQAVHRADAAYDKGRADGMAFAVEELRRQDPAIAARLAALEMAKRQPCRS
jgi:hypothetical protein